MMIVSRPSLLALPLACALIFMACGGDDDSVREASPTAAADMPTVAEPTSTTSDALDSLGEFSMEAFALPAGSRPHDVAPAADGGVWYTAQRREALGYLNPETGATREIPLGEGSAPHGVVVGPEGDAWVTDGGLNAIVRVDAETDALTVYSLPSDRPNANLNTAAFDGRGRIWFTGQNGIYGVLEPSTEEIEVFDAPRGPGPYGITSTPDGEIYFASLAGSYVGHVDLNTGVATVLELPTSGQGARRVWSDSSGRIWASEWNAGQLARYDPTTELWQEWPLPGPGAQAYAVYVDDRDLVWLSDFGTNTLVLFDPISETFTSIDLPGSPSNVRQLLGRPGELWAPESAADQLVVVRY